MFLLSCIPSMECLIHQRKQLCVSVKGCLLLFIGREEVRLNDHSCSFCLYNPRHIIKAQLLKSAFPSSILLIPYLTQNLVFRFRWLDLGSKPQGGRLEPQPGLRPNPANQLGESRKKHLLNFWHTLKQFSQVETFPGTGPCSILMHHYGFKLDLHNLIFLRQPN